MIDDAFIAKIHANCEDDCGCLMWQGSTGGSKGTPYFNHRSLRRVLFEAAFGEVPASRRVSMTCGSRACLNLEHMTLRTPGAVVRNTFATTDASIRLSAASTRSNRARSKLNIEIARAIRSSDEPLKVLAARYGVHHSTCGYIKAGQMWKETSPFSGLGARA